MSSWYEKEEAQGGATFDTSRLIWAGVIGLIVLMLGAMYVLRGGSAQVSQVQVRHILISTKTADPAERQRALELAQSVRQQVLDGESFEELARKYSGDPGSASRGGYLGWSRRGVYTQPVEEYVWNGEVGAISDLVPSEYGFHIIQIMDRDMSEADAYDAELDRKAWEEHQKEDAQSDGLPAPPPATTP